jgi:hypothetical protein
MAELGDHVLRSRDIAVVGLVAGKDAADEPAALLSRLGPTGVLSATQDEDGWGHLRR